ncbi:MAG: hypothetical protein GC199_00105 [Alphaproteobacteria bacterium]|nr:hypothetical protein [Alphaproteobacteria bacterium]
MREALGRVLAHPLFADSPRMKHFLEFVVEETLAGRADTLKGYTIGTAVFERGDDFDANSDPIVRVEATRLRRLLKKYYSGDGRADLLEIDLPKGGYVPVFEPREFGGATALRSHTTSLARAGPATSIRPETVLLAALVGIASVVLATAVLVPRDRGGDPTPTIAVVPFANLTGSASRDYFSRGLAIEIANELSRFRSLRVFAAAPGIVLDPVALDRSNGAAEAYLLNGILRSTNGDLDVAVRLQVARTGEVLWSDEFTGSMTAGTILKMESEIADAIVTQVAQPYGVIPRREYDRRLDVVPRDLAAYDCVLRAYEYWRTLDPKGHLLVRTCLEKAVKDEPRHAQAWAALAFVYADEDRYGCNPRPGASRPLDDAQSAAERAVALDPEDAMTFEALYGISFLRKDFVTFRDAGARALELNPNNPEILADFGAKLAYSGNWIGGIASVRRAWTINPALPGWARLPLVYDAYRRGDYELARIELEATPMLSYYRFYVLRAMIAGELGEQDAAAAALARVRALNPSFLEAPRSAMEAWGLPRDLIEQSLESLRRAQRNAS